MRLRSGRLTVGVVIVPAVLLATAAVAPDDGNDDDAFAAIFDGRTLQGWTPEHTDRYSVKGGVIVAEGGPGWLRYNKPLKDFELRALYRSQAKDSDGGVLFRASPQSIAKQPHWPVRGYQLRLAEGRNCLAVVGLGVAPPRFERRSSTLRESLKPPGQWQSIHLRVTGTHAEAALNGKTITVCEAIRVVEGSIGLRCEEGHLEWRDVKIKELPIRGDGKANGKGGAP
jgi:hypothetical protein